MLHASAQNLMDFKEGDGVMVIGGNHVFTEDATGAFVRLTAYGHLHKCTNSELRAWPLEVMHYWQRLLGNEDHKHIRI